MRNDSRRDATRPFDRRCQSPSHTLRRLYACSSATSYSQPFDYISLEVHAMLVTAPDVVDVSFLGCRDGLGCLR